MTETPKRREPEYDEVEGPPSRRERTDPGESEWVLERIQQTFDTPRD